jgi:endonuclease/exonuclease/phosphatase family metal-dependent hydrolase
VTLKVMSFNVYYGAGHERRFDQHVGSRFKGRDRLPDLIAYLREASPDVLAIEEAAGWDAGEPSVAEQIAAELGMTYVLAPDAWELHVVLFSKYPIVAAEYVSRVQDFNGVALRASVAVTSTQTVNVLAVHLNSMSRDTRACQVEAILDMATNLEGRTILLGDMNFRSNSEQAQVLREKGWQLAAFAVWSIDQIWLDGAGALSTGGWWQALPVAEGISDHLPVGAEITFDAPPSDRGAPQELVTEPEPLDYACPLPS